MYMLNNGIMLDNTYAKSRRDEIILDSIDNHNVGLLVFQLEFMGKMECWSLFKLGMS